VISRRTLISQAGGELLLRVHIICMVTLLGLRTEWENAPGIWNKEQIMAWRKIQMLSREGGLMFCQVRLTLPSFVFLQSSNLILDVEYSLARLLHF